jgi:hypothetical protein
MLTVFLFPMTKNYTAYNKEEVVFKKPFFFFQIIWTLRNLCGILLCYQDKRQYHFLGYVLKILFIFVIIIVELVTGTDEEKFISSCPPASSVFLQKTKPLF